MLERVSIAFVAIALLLLPGACDQEPAQSSAAAGAGNPGSGTEAPVVAPATGDGAPGEGDR